LEFRDKHGPTLVPRRSPPNPSLGSWVVKQRVNYRKFLVNETKSPLTKKQIDVLNDVGFKWDVEDADSFQDPQVQWRKRAESYRVADFNGELSSALRQWLRLQSIEYRKFQAGEPSTMNQDRIDILNEINKDWHKPVRQVIWEERMAELKEYQQEFGDTCVPIGYKNKKLATWVSNLRKRYKQNRLKHDQIFELNRISFVWDRWEHEFQLKMEASKDVVDIW